MPLTTQVCEPLKTALDSSNSLVSNKQLLSKRELAPKLGVSCRTIDNWIAQKRVPFLRLSARLIKFDFDRVMAALNRFEVHEVGRRLA